MVTQRGLSRPNRDLASVITPESFARLQPAGEAHLDACGRVRTTRRPTTERQPSLRRRRTWHTANVDSFTSAGVERVYWARNNANGIPCGPTGVLAAGADAAMRRLFGIQNFNIALQQPRRVNIPGDDGVKAQFIFASDTLPNGDMVLGVFDANLHSQAQGSKVYADGIYDAVVLQSGSPTFNQMTIMTISQAKSNDSGSGGEAGYMVVFWPKVQIVPLFATGLTNAGGSQFTHALTATMSSKLPWGESFTLANHGCTEAAGYGYESETRIMVHTHRGDGSDVGMTLTETPFADSTAYVKDWANGTQLVYGAGAGKVSNVATALSWGTAPPLETFDVVRYGF